MEQPHRLEWLAAPGPADHPHGLGAAFLVESHLLLGRARNAADPDDVVALKPMRLFHWSNMYLSLLFVAVALDPLITR